MIGRKEGRRDVPQRVLDLLHGPVSDGIVNDTQPRAPRDVSFEGYRFPLGGLRENEEDVRFAVPRGVTDADLLRVAAALHHVDTAVLVNGGGDYAIDELAVLSLVKHLGYGVDRKVRLVRV